MVSVTFYHCDGRADILAISGDSIEKVLKTIANAHWANVLEIGKCDNVLSLRGHRLL